jgi:hypothetical protein
VCSLTPSAHDTSLGAAASMHGGVQLARSSVDDTAVGCGAPAMEVMKMSLKSAGVRFGVPSGAQGSLPPPPVCSCAQTRWCWELSSRS